MNLPEEFLSRMQSELKDRFADFLISYERPPVRGIRVNTLKISTDDFRKISPFELEPVPWENNGFYVAGEGLGKTVYHAAGLYYVQEPSAMSAAPLLEVKRGERVLDLCSAPGGKGTQLAQYLDGTGLLVLNEINFSRAKILSSNVERMGVKNAVVTCAPPEKLSSELGGYFDKILVDAPCSGEGMFKKEQSAITEWSLENVAACAKRQTEILKNAFAMLAEGGRLVYSTCTFAPEEDELQVRNFVENSGATLVSMKKLLPHEVRGEGHFTAVIERAGGERKNLPLIKPAFNDKKLLAEYSKWERENLKISFANLHLVGQTLYALPDGMPEIKVQTLRAGVRLGEFLSGRFEPSHSLAMCLKKDEAEGIELDERTALNYLRGLTFDCAEDIKGWRLALFNGYPLGWCKVSVGTAKNKLPKGVRI